MPSKLIIQVTLFVYRKVTAFAHDNLSCPRNIVHAQRRQFHTATSAQYHTAKLKHMSNYWTCIASTSLIVCIRRYLWLSYSDVGLVTHRDSGAYVNSRFFWLQLVQGLVFIHTQSIGFNIFTSCQQRFAYSRRLALTTTYFVTDWPTHKAGLAQQPHGLYFFQILRSSPGPFIETQTLH